MKRLPVRWEIEPLERSRRGLDERLALLAPELNRRLNAFLLGRLRAGSSLRRALLTRAVRVGFAANNRRDYDAMQVVFHPDVEIASPATPWSDPAVGAAGMRPIYRGHEGMRQFLEDWKSVFDQFRYQPREIADAGDGRFAVRLDLVATIGATDTELHEEMWTVFILSRGLVVRNPTFLQWSETEAALRAPAVGLGTLKS